MSKIYDKLSKEKYFIGIPSRKRSNKITNKRGVWKYLDSRYPYSVHLVIRTEEIGEYSKSLSKFPGALDLEINMVKDDYNISQKRNVLIGIAKTLLVDYLFIIDDDVCFYYRDEKLSSKYTSKHETFLSKDCFNKILYESIKLCSEKFPIVGLPLKQGSFGLKYMFPKNIPIIRFVCYHVPTLIKENINATTMKTPFMSDRYVHLSLLNRGYSSLSNARYCVGDSGTGKPGGCQETRTVELQSEAAKKLQSLFPDYVSLKVKKDGHWNEERLDCVISWKKFLRNSKLPYIPMGEGLKLLDIEEDV